MHFDFSLTYGPYLRLKDGRGRASDGVLQVGDGNGGGGGLDGAHPVVDDGLGGSDGGGAARGGGLEGPTGEAGCPKHVRVESAINTGEQKG